MNTGNNSPSLKDLILLWIAGGFGIGFKFRFPGTVASLAICPLIWLAGKYLGDLEYLLIGLALVIIGLLLSFRAVKFAGKKDPAFVVWDEFAGMWLALAYLPTNPYVIAGAFAVFRLLDILKPHPVGWADQSVPGAWGLMLDDILAGILANFTLHGCLFLLIAWP